MRHRLQVIYIYTVHLRARGLRKGGEHSSLSHWVGTLYSHHPQNRSTGRPRPTLTRCVNIVDKGEPHEAMVTLVTPLVWKTWKYWGM